MSNRLIVHLNREGLYEVEPAVNSFETSGPFEIVLANHGQAVHVHVRLDDALSTVASLDGTNHFVDTEETIVVPVRVTADRPGVRGTLKVVTGYGSGTDVVEVQVSSSRGDDEPRVAVDEGLSRPGRMDGRDGPLTRALVGALPQALVRDEAPVVVGMVALALALAGGTWLLAPSTTVFLGVFAVLVGVAVAAYLLRS